MCSFWVGEEIRATVAHLPDQRNEFHSTGGFF